MQTAFRKAVSAIGALAIVTALSTASARAQYVTGATDLNPTGYSSSGARSNSTSAQYGYGVNPATGTENALAWSGSASSFVNLNPAGAYSSYIFAQAGGMEGGEVAQTSTSALKATLWNGTSTTTLQPATLSGASIVSSNVFGMSTDGASTGIQVGSANDSSSTTHAVAWFGTAASAIDLSAGLTYSTASAVNSNDQVVGSVDNGSVTDAAWLWNVNAANSSYTTDNLNPAGYEISEAHGISGSLVVGYGVNPAVSLNNHALVWNISNLSNITSTDLNVVLGSSYTSSQAEGVNGTNIVGNATIAVDITNPVTHTVALQNVTHAIWWVNGGASFIDLNAALGNSPSGTPYLDSYAYGIAANGDIVGIADYDTYNPTTGAVTGDIFHAVEWNTVPAPPALPTLAGGITLILGALSRRRRKA